MEIYSERTISKYMDTCYNIDLPLLSYGYYHIEVNSVHQGPVSI